MSFKDNIHDWKYMISKDNTKSRGFYMFITFVFALVLLSAIAVVVCSAMGLFSGMAAIGAPIAALVAVLLCIGVFVFLCRQ